MIVADIMSVITFCERQEKCDTCVFFKKEINRNICVIGLPKKWTIPKALLKEIPDMEIINEECNDNA